MSVWRWVDDFESVPTESRVTMGEGDTPVNDSDSNSNTHTPRLFAGGARMHPHDQLTTLVDESHQLIEDVESWNADHPDHQPLDCEFPRVMLYLSRRCLDVLARGRMKEFRKWSEYLVAHAEKQE